MDPLLTIDDLRTYFFLDEGTVRAVDGVDLVVPRGTTVGLVGESGCGKSVTAYSVLRLVSPPGRIVSGRIVLHDRRGRDVVLTSLADEGEAIRRIRGAEIAMIFQEPMTSLSPVHTVGSQIMEAVRLHTDRTRAEARAHAVRMMARVGVPDAGRRFGQYPHEMSGGLRQRAMIAMALACRPSLLIADEPTTALDVTVQAQIMGLLKDLQVETGMGLILITHDLGVVNEVADRVGVMYAGKFVETGVIDDVFGRPAHPYTEGLMASIPQVEGKRRRLNPISGVPPNLAAIPAGCSFHPRCPRARTGAAAVPGRDCEVDVPPLRTVSVDRASACHYSEELLDEPPDR